MCKCTTCTYTHTQYQYMYINITNNRQRFNTGREGGIFLFLTLLLLSDSLWYSFFLLSNATTESPSAVSPLYMKLMSPLDHCISVKSPIVESNLCEREREREGGTGRRRYVYMYMENKRENKESEQNRKERKRRGRREEGERLKYSYAPHLIAVSVL